MIKEVYGLKCPNHNCIRDNYNFMYEEVYRGCKPNSGIRCLRCGYTMALHKAAKY